MLITTLLAQAEALVLAACQHCAGVSQFTVLSAVSESAHHDETPALYGPSCFTATAASWQQQLNAARHAAGQGPCSLAILHCPLLLCPLSSSAFVLPAATAAAVLPRAGRLAAGYCTSAAAAAADAGSDDDEHPPAAASRSNQGSGSGSGAPAAGLSLLAHALVAVSASLGYRPEAFSLGPCSRQVSRAMAFVPAVEGDFPPAALVLVDRLLDPASPALHADLLVARLYDQLQPATDAAESAAATSGGGGGSGGSRSGGDAIAPFTPVCGEVPMPGQDPLPPTPAPALAAPAPAAAEGGHGATVGEAAAAWEGGDSLLPGTLRHPDDSQVWLAGSECSGVLVLLACIAPSPQAPS